jgi:hypothetical protein
MLRIGRVPAALDKCFISLRSRVHWAHLGDFRRPVLMMASAQGRHHVTQVSR